MALAGKEKDIMDFLHAHVFDPILTSPTASSSLKSGVRLTIVRMERLSAEKMIQYYWNAVIGTERSVGFSAKMRQEGFLRFEETLEDFRRQFDPPPSGRLRR
jgi:hypothetical protein